MKTKLTILTLGLGAFCLAAFAQDNMTTADTSTNNTEVSTNAVVSDTTTNAIASDNVTNAVIMENTNSAPMADIATNQPTAAPAEPEPQTAPAIATENTTDTTANPIIPLISMDDVPLTVAINNLARQANLNYMLDPKLAYGQPGPDGRVVAQPTISIRWENVTAQQALTALLGNNGLQLVEDPKTKIARVTIKDPALPDPLMTKVIQLQYASPSNVIMSVQTSLTDKRSKVIGDIRTSQLVVVATEKEQDAVDKLIQRLDKATKQVLIEARLLETSFNPSSSKGIDWTGTLQAQHLAFGNNLSSAGSDVNPTLSTSKKLLFDTAHGFSPATAFLDADGVNAVLSFLNQDSQAKVLSEPRTVTLDNEMAHIEVGQQYPIINVSAGTANTTGGSQITYSNLTVKLDVTPRISANNYINLRVSPHIMRLDHVQSFSVGGASFDVPIFDTRAIDTAVIIPSGNTLVMGGLVQDDVRYQNTKVPLLGDIPLLGHAFRSNSKARQKSNLLIFVTPTIVEDSDFRLTKTEFLKAPVTTTEEKEWSALDTGKAYDWSKLIPKKQAANVPAE